MKYLEESYDNYLVLTVFLEFGAGWSEEQSLILIVHACGLTKSKIQMCGESIMGNYSGREFHHKDKYYFPPK